MLVWPVWKLGCGGGKAGNFVAHHGDNGEWKYIRVEGEGSSGLARLEQRVKVKQRDPPPRSHTWNLMLLYCTVSTLKPMANTEDVSICQLGMSGSHLCQIEHLGNRHYVLGIVEITSPIYCHNVRTKREHFWSA